jgi:hypothetical protein
MSETLSADDWRQHLEHQLSAAAIAAHPEFPAICFEYVDRLLAIRRGERLMNQILAQRERETLGFILLCQHFEAMDGGEPPTLARLTATGLGSRRRIAAFVAVLRLAGLVRSRSSPHDRRIRILEPTERLITMHLEWSRIALRQVDRLLERPMLEAAFEAEPRLYRLAYKIGGADILSRRAFAPGQFPLVDSLTPHRAGHLIAASLVQAMLAAEPGRSDTATSFALPYGRLARRLGVSRSHVLNVLAEIQAQGHLEILEAGRQITITEAARRDLLGYFAYELAFVARHSLHVFLHAQVGAESATAQT